MSTPQTNSTVSPEYLNISSGGIDYQNSNVKKVGGRILKHIFWSNILAHSTGAEKCEIPFFQKWPFWEADFGHWLWTKLALWICPILWIRVNLVYTQLSLTFFIIIGRFGWFINKSKKSYFWKKCKFLNQKSAVEGPKRVLQGHHDSPRSALTFPTNPQIWFLNFGT